MSAEDADEHLALVRQVAVAGFVLGQINAADFVYADAFGLRDAAVVGECAEDAGAQACSQVGELAAHRVGDAESAGVIGVNADTLKQVCADEGV